MQRRVGCYHHTQLKEGALGLINPRSQGSYYRQQRSHDAYAHKLDRLNRRATPAVIQLSNLGQNTITC